MPPHTAVIRRQLFKMTFSDLFKCKCSVGTFFRLFACAVKIRGWKHQEQHGRATGKQHVAHRKDPVRPQLIPLCWNKNRKRLTVQTGD